MTYSLDTLAEFEARARAFHLGGHVLDHRGRVAGDVLTLTAILREVLALSEKWHASYSATNSSDPDVMTRVDALDDAAYDIDVVVATGLDSQAGGTIRMRAQLFQNDTDS